MTQKLFSGKSAISALKEEVKALNPSRILIVRGHKSYQLSGAKAFIDNLLEGIKAGKKEFYDFTPNPDIKDLEKGLELVKEFNPDLIIGIGGGSVLDTAKAIRFLRAFPSGEVDEDMPSQQQMIPMLAIPTTSGTGAECTKFAIYYKDKNKESLDHPLVVPDMVLLNPELTHANSNYLTACCGFDAFAQAIEALWNKNTTEESDQYARKALSLIVPYISDAVNSPDEENREKMMEGSYWAGRAINITRTTAPHAFAYTFTSHYGYPHGHAVALTFPALAAINLNSGTVADEKVKFILDTCGFDPEHIEEDFTQFRNNLGLQPKKGDYDIDFLAKGVNAGRLKNNPAEITPDIALEVIKKSLKSCCNE